MNLLKISGSPHVHEKDSVKSIMYWVVIAMLPAMAVSFYMFGLGAVIVTLASIIFCMIIEFLIQKFILKGPISIFDGSAIVTGILLAFNVPSNLPLYIVFIGALAAIGIGKMTFGGLGKNIFNPALLGRVVLLISFPVEMTSWPKPIESARQLTDVITGPTPLAILKEGVAKGESVSHVLSSNGMTNYMDFATGQMGGSVGEVSAFAILIGAVIMLLRKVITWHIPVAYLGSAALFSGILWLINPEMYVDPMFHILTGGMMLGVFFMATDMVTSPMSPIGQIVFGIGCGVLTIVIRVFGAYPEGVSFAILIMNAFVPIINNAFKPKRFGGA
jgi:Na+-translocating ferredoxin:NAD+ oxidoreductase subunit D